MASRKEVYGIVRSEKGFYVGDICYVLDEQFYDDFWGKKNGYEEGIFEDPKTRFSFAVAGTAYGDGYYADQHGNGYGVDAGVIGLVPAELIGKKGTGLGLYCEKAGEARFEASEGKFHIVLPNRVVIDIDTAFEEEDEEEDCWDDDEQ